TILAVQFLGTIILIPYTVTKKNIDKQHLERVIGILSQIINVKDEIEANFHNIKQGLHYLCSMISELSKETKGGYQEILWPEIRCSNAWTTII
ncbi:MAG: hypothetical protein NTW25_00055, partial [Candidatus Kapabacteria bacterium]|nr:hypothetical protein [Candidatus Kapabacteria bacterium]